MLKSYVIEDVLKEYEDMAKRMFEGYATGDISAEELAQMTRDFADAVNADVEARRDVINGMLTAFQERGLLSDAESGNTLANGIKGITEDTAGLLASYINAMRADVSGIRMMAEAGWKDVNAILNGFGVLPTLNDYMAQVAASNANIENHTRQILLDLEGMMTSASGRRALAVDVQ